MNREKIIAALLVFLYAVCLLGPIAALLRDGRGAFALLVAGLGTFGWPVVRAYIKTLSE